MEPIEGLAIGFGDENMLLNSPAKNGSRKIAELERRRFPERLQRGSVGVVPAFGEGAAQALRAELDFRFEFHERRNHYLSLTGDGLTHRWALRLFPKGFQ